MTKEIDTYKPKKDIKKVYEPELDLKNPAVLKKYQEIVASESGSHKRSLQQSQSRQRRPKVYQAHSPHPPRSAHAPNQPSEPAIGGASEEQPPHPNSWILLLILFIIAIIIAIGLLLYK